MENAECSAARGCVRRACEAHRDAIARSFGGDDRAVGFALRGEVGHRLPERDVGVGVERWAIRVSVGEVREEDDALVDLRCRLQEAVRETDRAVEIGRAIGGLHRVDRGSGGREVARQREKNARRRTGGDDRDRVALVRVFHELARAFERSREPGLLAVDRRVHAERIVDDENERDRRAAPSIDREVGARDERRCAEEREDCDARRTEREENAIFEEAPAARGRRRRRDEPGGWEGSLLGPPTTEQVGCDGRGDEERDRQRKEGAEAHQDLPARGLSRSAARSALAAQTKGERADDLGRIVVRDRTHESTAASDELALPSVADRAEVLLVGAPHGVGIGVDEARRLRPI